MKKILSYCLFAGFALLFTGCAGEEEMLFDKTAAERLNEMKSIYTSRLEAQPNGWAMQYYPTYESEAPFGNGYLILCDFNHDGTVRVAMDNRFSDNTYAEATSLWEVITDNGPVLTFNSENALFHQFSKPEDVWFTDDNETGTGIGGDYEFVVVDAPEDASYMMLKGKKRGTYNLLTPLEEGVDYAEYLAEIKAFSQKIFPASTPNKDYFVYDGRYEFTDASNMIPLVYPEGADPIIEGVHRHFLITKRGDSFYLRFRDKINLNDDNVVQDFRYDAATDRFISTDNENCVIEGTDANLFFNDLLESGWTWNLTQMFYMRNGKQTRKQYSASLFDDQSEAMKNWATQLETAFKKLSNSYHFWNVGFSREGGSTIKVAVRYGNTDKQTGYYNFSETNDNGTYTWTYQGPADTGVSTNVYNLVPELQQFLSALSQSYTVSAFSTQFNLSKVRLTSTSDPNFSLVLNYYDTEQ